MPLAVEVGIDAAVATRRGQTEVQALGLARAVVATGRVTIETLSAMGHRTPQPVLVEPGCDPAPVARGSGGETPHLLCVAAVTPGKGHAGLLRALGTVDVPVTLTCVGSLTRDPVSAERVARLVESLSLQDRVSLAGELGADRLASEYDRADVFVLNTSARNLRHGGFGSDCARPARRRHEDWARSLTSWAAMRECSWTWGTRQPSVRRCGPS